jgi:hypothetical protein
MGQSVVESMAALEAGISAAATEAKSEAVPLRHIGTLQK